MKETVMKNGLALLRAMDNIPAGMIVDSAIPAADAPAQTKEKGASFWERINTNGWVAAAIGLVVALGVVVLIVLAGRGAGGPGVAGTSAPVIPEDAPYAFVFEDQVAVPMEGMFWEHGNIGRKGEYQADGLGLPFELTESDDPPLILLRAGDAAGLQFVCRTGERVGVVWLWDADRRMVREQPMQDFSLLPEILDGKPGVYYVGVSIYRETATTRGEYCECIRLIVQSDADDPAQTDVSVPDPGQSQIGLFRFLRDGPEENTWLCAPESYRTIQEYGNPVVLKFKDDFVPDPAWQTVVNGKTVDYRWEFTFKVTYSTVQENALDGMTVIFVDAMDSYIPQSDVQTEKPAIYLYPTVPTVCSVRVGLDGRLTCTYPAHGADGWRGFTAHPDGTLVFPDGREYYCLYWEGVQDTVFDFSSGFCVRGEDTAAFLADALPRLGLSAREANEMIIYWLPRMQGNAYNVISFQTDAYTDTARLDVTPAPDTVIRVFMAWYGADAPVDIPAQTLTAPARDGFVLVEWGGAECR